MINWDRDLMLTSKLFFIYYSIFNFHWLKNEKKKKKEYACPSLPQSSLRLWLSCESFQRCIYKQLTTACMFILKWQNNTHYSTSFFFPFNQYLHYSLLIVSSLFFKTALYSVMWMDHNITSLLQWTLRSFPELCYYKQCFNKLLYFNLA